MDKLNAYISSIGVKAQNLSTKEESLLLTLSAQCFNQLVLASNNATNECLSQIIISENQSLGLDLNNTLNLTLSASTINDVRPFIPRWWIQLFWSLLFGIMVLVSVIGNLVVIWIVLANRRMRTVTNFFLFNLTIADLGIKSLFQKHQLLSFPKFSIHQIFLGTAVFNAPFNFLFMLNSHWPFGQAYCVINNFIANLTIASSVFTITATSIDRYVAIVHPLKPRMSQKKAISIIIIIWVCASIFSMPTLLFSRTVDFRYGKQIRTLCILIWPDGFAGQSFSDNVYNILFLLLTYVVPIISMAFTYTLIARVLWGSKGIGEFTEFQKESIKSKRKIVRMLMVVVVIFAICWLPYHLYFLYIYKFPEVVHYSFIQHVYLGIYWLAMSNSMYNWMIYCWMNKRFRNYFKQYLFCCIKGYGNRFSSLQRNGCYTNNTRSPTTRYDMVQVSNNYNYNKTSIVLRRSSLTNITRETRT